MFNDCRSLATAPALPATTLASNCYNSMFNNCTSLTTAPELPAKILVSNCYFNMFNGCSNLNNIIVKALTWNISITSNWLAGVAASGTFIKPVTLTIGTGTGEIPADSANGIPTGWTVAEMPVVTDDNEYITINVPTGQTAYYTTDGTTPTTSSTQYTAPFSVAGLGDTFTLKCISSDGNNYTSPVVSYDYVYMFYIEALENNTVLNLSNWKTQYYFQPIKVQYSTDKLYWNNIDYYMSSYTLTNTGDKVYFRRVTAATSTDTGNVWGQGNLNAVTSGTIKVGGSLEYACYLEITGNRAANTGCENMFQNCTGLVDASELKLFGSYYKDMFNGCTGLTAAPELPSTTLAQNCYQNMFRGCTSLVTAPSLPATTFAPNCYLEMFSGCSNLTKVEVGATSWDWSYATNWLNNVAAHGVFVKSPSLVIGDVYGQIPANSANGIPTGWTVIDKTTEDYFYVQARENSSIVTIPSGVAYSTDKVNWNTDGVQTGIALNAGDIVYLAEMPSWISGSSIETTYGTFNVGGNFSTFVTGDNTINYPTIVNQYNALFKNCTGLIDASNLKLNVDMGTVQYAFNEMFRGCTSLLTAPELPATTLSNYCYNKMFDGCTNLTIAPELPATTLVEGCYRQMFYECTSLTSAPELPATTLYDYSYDEMFYGCTSLNSIVCLATDITATLCTNLWVRGVAATGTFTKNPNMSIWATNDSGIPTGWTVVNV